MPLRLGDWRLVVLDSGERHAHAGGGYNERRAECARACELLGVSTLSEASADDVERLPEPLRLRARHVLGENERVTAAVAALRDGDMPALGRLLDASHESLRDGYEISTPAVEATVARLLEAGAAGARMVGGGFGGCVLGLFAPGVQPPADAIEVRPGAGAHLLAVRTPPPAERLAGASPQSRRDERARGHDDRQRQRRERSVQRRQQAGERQLLGAAVGERAHAADRARAAAQLARGRAEAPLGDAHRQAAERRSARPGARSSRR